METHPKEEEEEEEGLAREKDEFGKRRKRWEGEGKREVVLWCSYALGCASFLSSLPPPPSFH